MVEPYLGDVIGEPLLPMRPYPKRPRSPRWIENGVHLFIAWLAAAVFTMLLVIYLVLIFMFFSTQNALSEQFYKIPDACVALASKYRVHDNMTRSEAENVVAQLDQHLWWPGVRQCRSAVKRQWKL